MNTVANFKTDVASAKRKLSEMEKLLDNPNPDNLFQFSRMMAKLSYDLAQTSHEVETMANRSIDQMFIQMSADTVLDYDSAPFGAPDPD